MQMGSLLASSLRFSGSHPQYVECHLSGSADAPDSAGHESTLS